MRTKTILLTAALAVAGASSSMAQQSNVYSVNVVGYINVPVQQNKFVLVENPFNNSVNNTVTNVLLLNDTFDSSAVFTYTGGALSPVETYFAGFGWFPGTNVLNPGTGFFLFSTTNGTVTFTGSVQTNAAIPLPGGFKLVGSPYPGSLPIQNLGVNGVDSDTIFRFDNAGQALSDVSTYFLGYGWFETTNNVPVGGDGGPTNGFTPKGAEGFYYFNANASNNWNQAFSIQ